MNNNEDDILNKCLEYCINQNKLMYSLNEFWIVESIKKNGPTAILNTFANAKSLFDVEKNIIQISLKVILLNS